MLYPKNLEEKLGFDKIRQLLKDYCDGPVGQQFVEKMRFTDNIDLLRKLLAQADEFVRILGSGKDFPRNNFLDIEGSLKKAAIEGSFLFEEELYDLKRALTTLARCLSFFQEDEKNEFPELKHISGAVTFNPQLLKEIEKVIDERGVIRDNASPALSQIRRRIGQEEENLRRKLDQILRSLKAQGMAKDDASPTIREGRMVVPVPAEHKRRVKGFVHDSSASGQTVYIEPEEVLNINNEIRELEFEEREEIVRILTAVTSRIRPECPALLQANRFLGIMDFIRAKALLGMEMRAIRPDLVPQPYIEWYYAYHPLLYLSYQKQGKKVIPQSIRLEEDKRLLVISGPNAGGKSVTLKMVGLVQFMMQCGLLVPVLETSKMGIFKHIFMDFGDDQSLEDDLSTYSSHLNHMKHFLLNADADSLILIDEFGGGTEPQLGGAIAEAILEKINQQGAFGVITTHYGNLKFFADRTKGLVNGAMRYDVEHLQPLYQLDIGQPGSSFALEIAKKIGLPKQVVHNARQKAGSKQVNIENLLRQLELEKKELQEKNLLLERQQKEMEELKEKYQLLKDFQEQNRKKLINDAKLEAQRLLKEANRKIENTIREIRENNADKSVTRELRAELATVMEAVQVEEPIEEMVEQEKEKEEIEILEGAVQVGDYVKIVGQEAIGEVLELSSKDALIAIGDLKTKVKIKRLVRVSRKTYRQHQKDRNVAPLPSSNFSLTQKMIDFNPKLDLRGKRAEEVIQILGDFMDNAVLLSHRDLAIVHGKGDGILRQVVRDFLRKYREVRHMEDEHADRGGAGVTLVTLG